MKPTHYLAVLVRIFSILLILFALRQSWNAQSLLTVLLLAIAIYYLYFAIIDAVYWATLWQMSERSHGGNAPLNLSQENKANMLSTIIELLVSATLILKAQTISRKMLRLAA